MREYPNIQEYLEERLQQAAQRDAQYLKRFGVTPNETLLHILSKRAQQEALASYVREVNATLDHNIRHILCEEKRRTRKIKREETCSSVKGFSVLAIVFAATAGWSFHQHNIALGIIFLAGAFLTFILLWFVTCFDR